ncbi:hypothetical protein NP493_80g03046 [Ridgeia piscesae]|uniref:Uncharacterized protein n=1 Tax=Ridgeia piscesae TaxID=27915 RepID=A0AAD9P938_RIDPI|nr:hypothetical protein NP493_80g03046 [Ridgeia piscesae]
MPVCILFLAIASVSVASDIRAYGVCLTRCKNWYDGCKVGSRDRPTLAKSICRKRFLTCMRTCRKTNLTK